MDRVRIIRIFKRHKYYKNKQALQAILNDIFYFLTLLEESRNLKKKLYDYLTELFDEDKAEFMKRIEELAPPVRDKSKNWILQLEQKGIEQGIDKMIKNLILEGSSTEFICRVAKVSPEHVEKISKSMK